MKDWLIDLFIGFVVLALIWTFDDDIYRLLTSVVR